MLKELYRPLRVRDGDGIRTFPGFQVAIRQTVQLAAKGNGPARCEKAPNNYPGSTKFNLLILLYFLISNWGHDRRRL